MTEPDIPRSPSRDLCGTMLVHRRLLNESMTYRARRTMVESRALQYEMGMRLAARETVVTIPVVVHVVHNPARPEQNIGDEQIHSQLTVLNQDFRANNPDVSKVPDAFKPLVADAKIEFRLATRDPNGNPSNGIVRVPTDRSAFFSDDGVKASATGGADPWPSDQYLNTWVCQLGGGLLGYAQFPGGPPQTDGVVIGYPFFGTVGTATEPYHLGRTMTHEVGHWLDLFHIWGDDGTACNGDDMVADTPNQAGFNTGMPTFPHISCNNGPNGDMFMNYMDYTDDAGMYMFTRGQSTRMDACLEGERASFLVPKLAGVPAMGLAGASAMAGMGTGGTAAPEPPHNGELERLLRESERLTTAIRGVVAGNSGG